MIRGEVNTEGKGTTAEKLKLVSCDLAQGLLLTGPLRIIIAVY